MQKPFSQACENNKPFILEHLKKHLRVGDRVLEVGSGTGQHAVCFGGNLPELTWQCSDLLERHAGINAWLGNINLPNVLPPIELDVMRCETWPKAHFDAIYTANTLHIMPWDGVIDFFALAGTHTGCDGKLICYGPFQVNGEHTSASNARFDVHLKSHSPHMGIRDLLDVIELGKQHNLELCIQYQLPANNLMTVFIKRP